MSAVCLTQVSGIAFDGLDARRFAQTQFSGNVEGLQPEHWQWNAWLDAQGRVRWLMHLVDPGDGSLLAIARGGDTAAVRAELSRYLLRTRATLSLRTFTGFAGEPLPLGTVQNDRRGLVLGYGDRSLQLRAGDDRAAVDQGAANHWRLTDIRAGWPTLPRGDARWLPPALGLERLGAVAFDKGCYPGQEIAVRLHYRGGHKLRLHRLRGPAALPTNLERADDGAPIQVLDSREASGGFEALVIAAGSYPFHINILNNIYEVISTFDA